MRLLYKGRPLYVALSAAFALCGCAVGPSYHRPATPTPPAFKEAGGWIPAEPTDQHARGPWWQAFGDSTLDRLESGVEVTSYTLAAAEAQYREASALATISAAGLFPAIGAEGAAARQRTPARSGSSAQTTDALSAGLTASWELDLWGRLRRTREAGLAQKEASAADLESARLSLHAFLAQTYFSLRTVDANIRLIDHLTQGYAQSLQFTLNQYSVGVAARSDVDAAQAQLKQAQAQEVDLRAQRSQLEHALAVILGRFPSEFSLEATDTTGTPPIPPLVLPSELLQRRPDVAAAERRLAAASASIGIAVAGYFPTVGLSGNAGYQGSTWSKLFTVPNEIWAVGTNLAETLFAGGKVRAGVAEARAVYDENLADYRQTVLTAFQEVEDDLAAVRILAQEQSVQDEAVAAARQSQEHTLNQYMAGTVSHLNVITAQATLLDAERTGSDLLGRRYQAVVDLYKALGGDWRGGQ